MSKIVDRTDAAIRLEQHVEQLKIRRDALRLIASTYPGKGLDRGTFVRGWLAEVEAELSRYESVA